MGETMKISLWMMLTCLAISGILARTTIRREPNYNPYWVQPGHPMSVTCILEDSQRTRLVWEFNGVNPTSLGFRVKNSIRHLDSGKVRTSSTLSKDVIGYQDIPDSEINCYADKDGDELHEVYITTNIVNVHVENANVTEGEDVDLKCQPDVGGEGEEARVVWSRDGHVITDVTPRRRLEDKNRTLVIISSRPQDAGVYQCKVLMKAGENDEGHSLEQPFVQDIAVSGKPYLRRKTSSKIEIMINDTLTITCPVAAHPLAEVFWLRGDDAPVQMTSRVTTSPYMGVEQAQLHIADFSRKDLGVYVCVAENAIGRLKKYFYVGQVGGARLNHASSGLLVSVVCVSALLMLRD